MNNICIIGSTGSVGKQALKLLAENPHIGKAYSLACRSNIKLLSSQIAEHRPKATSIFEKDGIKGLISLVNNKQISTVLFASSGTEALPALKTAIKAGKKIALANKELLVVHGKEIMALSRKHHNPIIPVDSEHSAIFQCLEGETLKDIEKIILTCSGGPFYGYTRKQLEKVTLAQALKHPKWNMGSKITIDSATLMNKGFELIEACYLFSLKPEQIEIAIHPECIIHSIVQFKDGSAKAQLSTPDMRHAIAYALSYKKTSRQIKSPSNRTETNLPRLTLKDLSRFTFLPPDLTTFQGPSICINAFNQGDKTLALLEKANNSAVQQFLQNEIKFSEIYDRLNQIVKKG